MAYVLLMTNIVNLTPHTVIIIRSIPDPHGSPSDRLSVRMEYPACAPGELPRALEEVVSPEMALTDSGSDGQGGYENSVSLDRLGVVDTIGYVGVIGLPHVSAGDRMFGLTTFYIVSIVTAIGALAANRGIEDLLIPCGQVRDAGGRIIGASGLAPATSLLTPMYEAITKPYRVQHMEALEERNAARAQLASIQ